MRALRKIEAYTRGLKAMPPCGLALFSGTAESGKVELVVIEPPRPIRENVYRCDRRFHVDLIAPLFVDDPRVYGIVAITGTETQLWVGNATQAAQASTLSARLQKRQKKGGQSQARIARLAEETRARYVRAIIERMNAEFASVDTPLHGILVLGAGELARAVASSSLLDYRLKLLPIVVDRRALDMSALAPTLETLDFDVLFAEDTSLLDALWERLDCEDPCIVYGAAYIERCVELGLVKTLIVAGGRSVKPSIASLIDNVIQLRTHCPRLDAFGGVLAELYYAPGDALTDAIMDSSESVAKK